MLDFLDKIREKPEQYRRTIAILLVSIITGIIFLVWATDSFTRLSRASLDSSELDSASTAIKSSTSFDSLTNQLTALLAGGVGILDSLRGPIEYNSSSTEVP
jgi:uncharacterized membrane protein YjjP (DUF1212 family)